MTTGPTARRDAPPADLPLKLCRDVRVLDDGQLIVGGWPMRMLRLSETGARAFEQWRRGGAVGEPPPQRALAQRLLDDGILCPAPEPLEQLSSLTIVVPVRDRAAELDRCLKSVRASCPASSLIVVDDGSEHRCAVQAVCAAHGGRLLRHDHSHGAAAARNTGLRACTTDLVAFVDSDVVLPVDWARRLLGHFADPRVGAVAPRIKALPPIEGRIGAYEARHSPLDMGARAGCVVPGGPTPYVPSAALIVRRTAADVGFDPALPIGEDIDLVWRMRAGGWAVRYEPDSHVWHDHRERLGKFIGRRRSYAISVALLAKRHPDALPAARVNPPMALPWILLLTGRPHAAAGLALAAAVGLSRRIKPVSDRPYRLAGILVARGLLLTGRGLGQAIRRAWAPPLLLTASRSRRSRRILAAAFVAPIVEDALTRRELRSVPAHAALRLLDEAVALSGTLEGCARERTVRPLLPAWTTARMDRSPGR